MCSISRLHIPYPESSRVWISAEMGLTGRVSDSSALTSQEEPQLRYTYRFRVEAKKTDPFDDAESRAEVQSYINDLLGVKEKLRERIA
jgi:hypothetical protein